MRYLVKFRYYPGDPLVPFRREDLDMLARECGLSIEMTVVQGAPAEAAEKTLDQDLETVSQTVLTIGGEERRAVEAGLRDLITRYRSPRTVFGLWGSNPEGEALAWEVIEANDGWW